MKPMGLTCVMLCAIAGSGIVADSVVASEDYQYWHPPSAAYRRQSYDYDTSPNLNNMLTEPGVAAAVFFAGSGALANFIYTTLKCDAVSNRLTAAENAAATNAANILSTCTQVKSVLATADLSPISSTSTIDEATSTTSGNSAVGATRSSVITALNTIENKLNAILGTTITCPSTTG